MNYLIRFILLLCCFSAQVCWLGEARAQKAAAKVGMADCVEVIAGDSIHMFFNNGYALVPIACATIRRECRISAQGNFSGEVRDYEVSSNALFHKLYYANNQREGTYEEYYARQRPATTGQFSQGRATGIWRSWYANGRPRVEFEPGNAATPRRITAHWDSAGRADVIDGNGIWDETGRIGRSLAVRNTGKVVNGLMEGVWEQFLGEELQPRIAENYQAGKLQSGQESIGQARREYQQNPLLGPQARDASADLEPFNFGMSCQEQSTFLTKITALNSQVAALLAAGVTPQPPSETPDYLSELSRQLFVANTAAQRPFLSPGQTTVTARVDAAGVVEHFHSSTKGLAAAFSAVLLKMGPWTPAKFNGTAVPSEVYFQVEVNSQSLKIRMGSNIALPLPATALAGLKPAPKP